jgi:dienelactone hydrolase
MAYVSKTGPYMVQSYTSGYRNGPSFADATVYYPTGDAQPPFAIVAVVPGYLSPQSIIQGWGSYLASHGIVTITIGTNSTSDQPPVRAMALLDALESLKGENTRMGSPLVGKLDVSRMGVMGHSMGGGGTLIAAQDNPTLKAAIGLNPWDSGGDFSKMTVPALIFTATGDTTAAPTTHAYPFYMQIPSTTKKMLWSQQGSSHGSAINPSGASGQIGGYGVAWMKVFLEGDERYIPILKTMPTGTARFENNL